jgi:hypothetical protein
VALEDRIRRAALDATMDDYWLVLKSAFLSRFYIIILHLKYQ